MKKIVQVIFRLLLTAVLLLAAGAFFFGTKSIHDLLGENKQLKAAIGALTREDQIGCAKVTGQEIRNGILYTKLRFIETARDDRLQTVLERDYEIEGDTVYFDALIVTFADQAVMDGKERSLYIWRRVYGDRQAPSDGFPIAEEGREPARYRDLLARLRLRDRDMFWSAIWDLANDPDALQRYGIKAVYGNAVYKKLRPGLIYVFKISATGQVYPETVPDI